MKKIYVLDDSQPMSVVSARVGYNKDVIAWEKAEKAEKHAHWDDKTNVKNIGDVYPYHIRRDRIPDYREICRANGFDVSELENVKTDMPENYAPPVTTAHITVKRTMENPVGLTLCPTAINGDSDAVWEFLKKMRENVKGVIYDKKARGYYVPSVFLMDALEYLTSVDNPLFDCDEMLPYAEIISGWGNMYQHAIPENPERQLYPYQSEDAQRLLDFRRGLLALEMGLGKTLVAICAAVPVPGKKLVVCPASLRGNWVREIQLAFPSISVSVKSNRDFSLDDDFTIVSYETLTAKADSVSNGEISVLIADEGHMLKACDSYGHPASRRAAAYLQISAFTEFAFILTGTPLINGNHDLWNFMVSANQSLTLGDFAFTSFIQTFTDAEKTRFGWTYHGYKNADLLNLQLRQIMVRRKTKDVFPDLKKDRESVFVDIDTEEYDRKVQEYLEKRDTDKAAALVALLAARLNLAMEKAKATVEYIRAITQDNAEKVVIFTEFRESAEFIQKQLGKACVSLTGKVSDRELEENKERFQTDDAIRYCVCTYKKAGTGHTLTASHILVISDLPWTFADVVQAEARICRISQREIAQIRFILSENVNFDAYMAKKVCGKSANANAVIDDNTGDLLDLNMSKFFSEDDTAFDDNED